MTSRGKRTRQKSQTEEDTRGRTLSRTPSRDTRIPSSKYQPRLTLDMEDLSDLGEISAHKARKTFTRRPRETSTQTSINRARETSTHQAKEIPTNRPREIPIRETSTY